MVARQPNKEAAQGKGKITEERKSPLRIFVFAYRAYVMFHITTGARLVKPAGARRDVPLLVAELLHRKKKFVVIKKEKGRP